MTNRDPKGRYAKRSTGRIVLLSVLVVAGLFTAMSFIDTTETYTRPETATSTPEVVSESVNPLDEIKARETFKKRVENQAKQVFINEEIEDREAQIAALEAEIATLQSDLETTRQEELDLQ